MDYRKLEALLFDAPELPAAVELKTVRVHSSFQMAAQRLLGSALVAKLLADTLDLARVQSPLGARSELAALDRTCWK